MEKRYAKKRFSQNFLNDQNILNKIANVIDINNRNIIEIGPGKGALTQKLIEKANQVVAFEIDNNLYHYLLDEIKSDNLRLINQDFLKSDLSNFNGYDIVANIPYNISTDIIFKIFENYDKIENVVLLVQKEFAQRICAQVGQDYYSKLAPTTKLFYKANYCFDVDASCFWPKPKVTSAVIHLERNEQKYDVDHKEFMKFIKQSFSMRRKTFWNNVKNIYFNQEDFKFLCEKLKINQNIRPEELNFDQLLLIFKNIKK